MHRLLTRLSHKLLSLALALLTFIALASWSGSAEAAGRVVWKSTIIEEKGGDGEGEKGYWRLDLEVHLPRAPDVAYYPVRFEFQPTAYYERALLDGKDGPQEMTQVLSGQQSLIESQDLGFMDPGTGKTQARTRFTFKVTRGHGYSAGEYKVTLRDGSSGSVIGTPTTLKFKGLNKIVDRRSMVFQSNDTKKKKKEQKEAPPAEETSEATASPESDEPSASEAPSEGNAPPPVEGKPGGGCSVAGPFSAPNGLWPLGLLALALALSRRAFWSRIG